MIPEAGGPVNKREELLMSPETLCCAPFIAFFCQVPRDALQVVIRRSFTVLWVQPAHHSSGALAAEIDFRDQGVAEEDQDSIFESFDGDVLN